MKKLVIACICIASSLAASPCFAQQKAPLGEKNLALIIDSINFTDDLFTDIGDVLFTHIGDESGVYLGIEGYMGVTDRLYIGGSIGKASNFGIFGGENIDYIPIELNAKYVVFNSPHFSVDIGAGVSYSHTKSSYNDFNLFFWEGDEDIVRGEDWLWGGQIFMDLTGKFGWFLLGLHGKYQGTQEFKNSGFDMSNYRIGMNIGVMF